jgi:Tol biopolymer transport system component
MVFSVSDLADDGTGLYVADVRTGRIKWQILPPGTVLGSGGSWSPKGNQILFSMHGTPDNRQGLWVSGQDGSGLRPLNIDGIPCGGRFDDPTSIGCNSPVWSPDGSQIAFNVVAGGASDVYVANSDGSDPHQVSFGDDDEVSDWGVTPR